MIYKNWLDLWLIDYIKNCVNYRTFIGFAVRQTL